MQILNHKRSAAFAPPPGSDCRAFTLIEMLVVIAIIALLMTLLAPVAGRTMENSRRSTCAGNIRSLTQGLLSYANDHQGFFPPTAPNSNSWPWDGDWAIRYSDFYKNYLTDKEVYFCPTALKNEIINEGTECYPVFPSKASNAWRVNISYAYFFGYDQWEKDGELNYKNGRNGYANMTQVFAPSQSTIIADVMKLGSSTPSLSAAPGRDWNHQGNTYKESGGHMGYADGHVRWVTMNDGFLDEWVNKSGGRNYYIHQVPQ
ncbi:type II secretion system protein [Kiritimatiellaeota bacterium B1221]|nr:type II secretion system protein [Kiritimatiellaeota bacterium B1221]